MFGLSPLQILRLAPLVLAAGLLTWLAWDYRARGHEITRLEAVIADYEEAARALDARARTLSVELERLTRLRAHQSETLHEEIRRAPESDDAPVAPVLRNTLDRLRQR